MRAHARLARQATSSHPPRAPPQNMLRPRLTPEQRAQLVECFGLMDADGSGAIDADEMGAAFKARRRCPGARGRPGTPARRGGGFRHHAGPARPSRIARQPSVRGAPAVSLRSPALTNSAHHHAPSPPRPPPAPGIPHEPRGGDQDTARGGPRWVRCACLPARLGGGGETRARQDSLMSQVQTPARRCDALENATSPLARRPAQTRTHAHQVKLSTPSSLRS